MFVTERACNLIDQLIMQAIDQVAHMILHVADVQVLPAPIAGVKQFKEIGKNLDDCLATGKRLVSQMTRAPALGISRDNSVRDFWKCFLDANISGHQRLLINQGTSLRLEQQYRDSDSENGDRLGDRAGAGFSSDRPTTATEMITNQRRGR